MSTSELSALCKAHEFARLLIFIFWKISMPLVMRQAAKCWTQAFTMRVEVRMLSGSEVLFVNGLCKHIVGSNH